MTFLIPAARFHLINFRFSFLSYTQTKSCYSSICVTQVMDKRINGESTQRWGHHPTPVKNRFVLLPKGSWHFCSAIYPSLWMPGTGYQKGPVSMWPPGFFGSCHTQQQHSAPKLTVLRSCWNLTSPEPGAREGGTQTSQVESMESLKSVCRGYTKYLAILLAQTVLTTIL